MVRESLTQAAVVIVVLSIGDLRYLLFNTVSESSNEKGNRGLKRASPSLGAWRLSMALPSVCWSEGGQGGENFPGWVRLGETLSDVSRSLFDAAARTRRCESGVLGNRYRRFESSSLRQPVSGVANAPRQ